MKRLALIALLGIQNLFGNLNDELSHIPNIEKKIIDVENEKGTLIHCKQVHIETHKYIISIRKFNEGDKDAFDEYHTRRSLAFLESVNLSNFYIYSYLSDSLIKKKKSNNLYVEGFNHKGKNIVSIYPLEDMSESMGMKIDLLYTIYGQNKDLEQFTIKNRLVAGAGETFKLNNRSINLYTADLNKKYILDHAFSEGKTFTESNIEDTLKLVISKSDMREDLILEELLKMPGDKYLIFGAYHDFSNNIEKYNEKHPENKHDLVTFTSKIVQFIEDNRPK